MNGEPFLRSVFHGLKGFSIPAAGGQRNGGEPASSTGGHPRPPRWLHLESLPYIRAKHSSLSPPLPFPLQYEILTTTADGSAGGRHHLFASTVSGGALYTIAVELGDKRWVRGSYEKLVRTVLDSFIVA